jgi:hypothetical protein
MITRIEVITLEPSAPDLILAQSLMPNDDPVQIRNIEGLGPVKSDVSSTPFATGRGERFEGSSTGKRNIVLSLGLNPNWADQTITSLRQLLYHYFMTGTWVTLRFVSLEMPTVKITGMVETFEPNLFSEDPEMQISILCPKPDFIDVETTLIYGTTDEGADVLYTGTAPSGFEMRVKLPSGLSVHSGYIDIVNTRRGEEERFSILTVYIYPTNYLRLTTVRSSRAIELVTYATHEAINILAKMDRTSAWPELLPGQNAINVFAGGPTPLEWIMGYFNRYGGL